MEQKIYVNCRFLTQKITGVQRFGIEICKKLKELYEDKYIFLAPNDIKDKSMAKALDVVRIGSYNGHIWEQIDLPAYLKKEGSPPLLNLCNTSPLFYRKKFITQHDINYVRYPESFSYAFRLLYNNMVSYNTKHCIHVFTVSNHSKNELELVYGLGHDDISVINNSVDSKFHHIEDAGLQKEKYILAASSSPTPNKNFEATVEAFYLLQEEIGNIKLYVFGDCRSHKVSGHTMDIEPLRGNKSIKFLGRVDDETLVKIYSNAVAFIYPSRYEGFGIPPLEAQACGCPVVSSLLSSLPEVLGDSAILCDPNDYQTLAKGLLSLIEDEEKRQSYILKGYENIKRFSWEKSAKEINKVIVQKISRT